MLNYHIFYNTKQRYLSSLFGQRGSLINLLHTYLLSSFRSSDKISGNSTYIAKGENEKTMANIHDYLYWRGDLPLDQIPLNEPDGLVLTRFSYMPFEELTLGQNETVGSLCKKLKTLPADKFRLDGDARFVILLNEADRFNQLPVSDFVKHNDADAVVQFAAITLYLPDDSLYIAYCGTDSTLVGWKEDFYMSFMEDVPAQMEALDYARKILKKNPGKSRKAVRNRKSSAAKKIRGTNRSQSSRIRSHVRWRSLTISANAARKKKRPCIRWARVQGMQMVYKQMLEALEKLGVKPIEAVGQPFDPNYHNAVMHEDNEEAGESEVVAEFQKGYMYHDDVIRHSMVKVAN